MPASRLIVFDLDGTLVDSRRDIADAANDVLIECGADPLPETAIGRMVGEGAGLLIARAFAAADRERPADALERFLRCYDRRLIAHTRPYPGIGEVLAQLAPAHRLAVLTNKPLAATRQILGRLGLAHHFAPELVFGGDGPYPRKPDAEGLRALIAMTGSTPSTTWLVGDSVVDWRTAQAAGSSCCLCRYGFGFEGVPAEVLTENQPVIDSPAELPVILASAACNES